MDGGERVGMLDEQEKINILRAAIKRCYQASEDGWEDDDFGSIAREVKKIFSALSEKLGWPKDLEIEKKLRDLKDRYGNSRKGLEDLREAIDRIEKEWSDRVRGYGKVQDGVI